MNIKEFQGVMVEKSTDDGIFNIKCPKCKSITKLNCDLSRLELELLKHKCVHETIKEEIDALFEQAILGAACFHNGRLIFQGKDSDRVIDYALGFSGRGHRKRTMNGYMLMDEISFKNTYLLLGAILEEIYNLILRYLRNSSINYSDSTLKLPKKYTRSTFKTISEASLSKKIRFINLAYCTQLIANIIKHTGGIIDNESDSGMDLIKLFSTNRLIKNDSDVMLIRNFININKVPIGEIFFVITRLYVCIIDLVAEVFHFKNYRLTNTQHDNIINNIVNYDIREEFRTFAKSIKDGSVRVID